MHTLRGLTRGTKLTVFILLAFGIASLLTISHSRPTYAESPSLLGTVRCVLRTVLLASCQPAVAPTNDSGAPTSSTPSNSPTPVQPSPSNAPASSPSSTHSTATVPVQSQEVALPEQTIAPYPDMQQVAADAPASQPLPQSDYFAYFNAYSPYAVKGAQAAAAPIPIQQSSEGWKLFGVAWYWWGITIAAMVVIFTSVRRHYLRRTSVLREGG